ncbi:aspartate carbamoyltransferase, partial [Candidatus Bipolaricaulota bacterium]|nr:aspartate carbamoyltransferase [Candidatus Bipolaricaulota bacterium]
GTDVQETEDLAEGLKSGDVLYMTRIQKERFEDPAEYERLKSSFVLTREQVDRAKDGIVIMHPLPRVSEISEDVDSYVAAAYFRQAANGVPVRMALLALVAGRA